MNTKKRHLVLSMALVAAIGGTVGCARISEKPLLGMNRFTGIKQVGTLAPRRSEDIQGSNWGLQINKWDLPPKYIDLFVERMAESGVKWARVETRSYPVKYSDVKGQGYYRWNEFDRVINGLSKHKIQMFITMNGDVFRDLQDEDIPLPQKSLDKWLEYVRALVTRYHDRVHYWEVFNEPKATPDYGEIVKAVSKTIKKIDPSAKIIAGSIARVNVESVRLLLQDYKVGPFVDVITYHPYNEFPEASKHVFQVPIIGGYEVGSGAVADMFKLIEQENRPIALWQGECGYPSSEHTSGWKGRGPWGENIQAKWLLRRFMTDFSMGIPVDIYFLLREPPEGDKVNAKGLLRYGTWQPKQGYRALQHITSLFDQRFANPKKVGASFEFKDEGSFYGVKGENLEQDKKPYSSAKSPYPIEVIGLTGSGGDAVVYYAPWRMQEYVKPAKINIHIKDVSIDDPVVVDMLTGQVYKAPTSVRGKELVVKGVPLTDYPIAVVPKSCVKMQ